MRTATRTAARSPGAFRIDDPAVAPLPEPDEAVLAELEPGEADAHRAVEAIAHPKRRGIRWGVVAAAAGGALLSLSVGIGFDALVRDLFARAEWLGWVGLGLIALFVLALAAMVGREVLGLFRLKRLARLRLDADSVVVSNERESALDVLRRLSDLYNNRAETAQARRRIAAHREEIIDGRDLLLLAERDLVLSLDARAKGLASAAARRVSVVTAVSPRAVFDIAFVLYESTRLIRRIAALYGGRPGTLGMLRLLRAVLGHLAVTGSIAVGDTLVQQLVGHGLAGRLSTKLGEGVVNGLMTARIGLSAMDVCRPLPFLREDRPRLKDIAGHLVTPGRDALREG